MKKLILGIVISILVILMSLVPNMVYATNLATPVYFGITALRTNSTPNWGYSIGNPDSNDIEGLAAPIWNIVKLSGLNSNDPTEINAYCVTAGIGFSDIKTVAEYDVSYDMRTQRDEIKNPRNPVLSKLATGVDVIKDGKTVNSYDALLSLTDLLYLYGESTQAEKNALLEAAGIYEGAYDAKLSDDEIEAIQQAAIWYFTNYDEKVDEIQKYNKYDNVSWLWYTENGKDYKNLADYLGGDFPPNEGMGRQKQEQAEALYKYLIDKAIENTAAGTTTGIAKLTLYASNKSNQEQPIVVIEKEPQEFDLALRKYITKVDGVEVASTRVPNIDTTTIESDKTATYKHRKDPIIVSTESVVTYQITIYNEGDIDGRATKIIDQLPTGLEYSKINTAGYTANYDVGTNRVTITRESSNTTNLKAYKEGQAIDSETIEIECIVTALPDKTNSKILTNVAWIDEEVDVNGVVITTQVGQDRDSTPKVAPDVNKDNMENYKGTTTETDLSKSDTYYPGQEDDDDFEKLILQPSDDIFDLKLIKRITQVNNQNVPERLKSVDISKLASGEETTADYKMEKEPVSVKTGDIVTYTFRVYNEGDIDGYAEEITENIPEGLEFVWSDKQGEELENDATLSEMEKIAVEFNQNYLWEISDLNDTNKATQIKTQYLGRFRGQEAPESGEDNRVEITENLIKAFDSQKAYTDTQTDKNPDYKEVSVMLKVVAPDATVGIIRNEAAITQDSDKDGKPVDDRDSVPEEWNKEDGNKFYDEEENWPVYREDDEDYDNIILKEFDLALRKFITQIENEEVTSRIPQVNYDEINDKITYTHPKNPLDVANGYEVTYTIRVFNEGEIDGYAKEIMDDLPDGLRFLPDNEINTEYRWKMYRKVQDGENVGNQAGLITRGGVDYIEVDNVKEAEVVVTDYLSKEQEKTSGENLLKAFNPVEPISDTNPSYKDVKIVFEVVEPNNSDKILVNSAQISDDSDENGDPVKDVDSEPGKWNEGEDDQDKEYVKLTYFDLALRKFITQITDEEVTTRIPQVSYDEENQKITYTHPKDPLDVVTGDIVTYTIRVYNEGKQAGYAKEIMDDLPDGLKFLPDNEINTEYRWKMYRKVQDGEEVEENADVITRGEIKYIAVDNVEEAEVIVTDYLSKEQEKTEGENLLNGFEPTEEISDTNPSYKDVKVAFEVVEPNGSDKILVNSAQISEDSDENGKPVDDIDSKPGEWNEGEDDQDKEYVKLTYFDLALRKWVTQAIVIENGKETITQTGHTPEMDPEPVVKVELNRKNLKNITVKFRYSIRITNEGDIAGYAKEITDYVPEGLKFVAEDNPGWTDEGNNIISTRLLENTLLQPGETADVEVLLTWINNEDNLALKTNTAEISEDYNDKGVPDRDSTPDNQKPGEDDIDDAPVILSISTGQVRIYFTLGFAILITIASGVILIKKFVL